MCGFFGIYDAGSKPDAHPEIVRKKISAGLKEISHRGPDGRDLWVDEGGGVGLGHVRLSIIDLEGGRQPLVSADGQIHAVVNGEFYGYQKIRKEMMDSGHKFRTSSDSEVLIALYQEYGVNGLTHLRGEFSFILYDANHRKIFAARDRFGIKPMYYC